MVARVEVVDFPKLVVAAVEDVVQSVVEVEVDVAGDDVTGSQRVSESGAGLKVPVASQV